jgi:hypothetical protein
MYLVLNYNNNVQYIIMINITFGIYEKYTGQIINFHKIILFKLTIVEIIK